LVFRLKDDPLLIQISFQGIISEGHRHAFPK
jgi:hypothetical protein